MSYFFFFLSIITNLCFFFFSSRRRHTRSLRDWSSDVCSSDLFGSRSVPIVTDHGRVSRLASRARRGGGGMGLERIGEAVRQRRVSAVELVRQSLERIERLDGELGAVVALRAERALEEAAALDRRAAGGAPLGPLAGAPLLVKDIEDVEGM